MSERKRDKRNPWKLYTSKQLNKMAKRNIYPAICLECYGKQSYEMTNKDKKRTKCEDCGRETWIYSLNLVINWEA